jgi:hypothetical protein
MDEPTIPDSADPAQMQWRFNASRSSGYWPQTWPAHDGGDHMQRHLPPRVGHLRRLAFRVASLLESTADFLRRWPRPPEPSDLRSEEVHRTFQVWPERRWMP